MTKQTGRKRCLIYETVLEHVKAQLLKGALRAGDRLPTVAALARQLGVGQASVREAYRVLETMGIVEVARGRGTSVSRAFDPQAGGLVRHLEVAEKQNISHLLEARKMLEPAVAALAAGRATRAEADAILQTAEEMEHLAQQGLDFIEPDILYHELIFAAAHNPVIARIVTALNDLLLDSRRLTTRIPHATEKAIHFHKLIALAIQDGNADAARSLMYQHVDDVERSVQQGGRVGME